MTEPNDEAALVELYSSHLGGGPAFPATFPQAAAQGMTIRDVAALASLGALIAKAPFASTDMTDTVYRKMARSALYYADAFVAERAKRTAP